MTGEVRDRPVEMSLTVAEVRSETNDGAEHLGDDSIRQSIT